MTEDKSSWKQTLRSYATLFLISGAVIALDQLTKALVRTNLGFEQIWSPWPWLMPYARIVHWNNTGAAFGMLQGFGDVFMILAIIVALAILYYFPQVPKEDWPLRIAMGLQLGGAVGNLIDRLTIGRVTDFISVGTFPVFNIADASISIGVAILIIGVWWKDREEKAAQPPSDAESPSDPPSDSLPKETWGE